MKLVIASGIYPPDHGGPATFVPALASRALEEGWAVQVVTLADDVRLDSKDGWPVTRIPRHQSKPMRVSQTALAIAEALRESDVLFSNGLFEESALASRLTHRPWVAKFVGDPVWERHRNRNPNGPSLIEFNKQKLSPRNSLRRQVLTRCLRTTTLCLTPSLELQQLLKKWSVPNVQFVPNGVELSPVDLNPNDIDVVTVCRLVPWKNVANLMIACHNAGASLHIVGDGPLRNELQKLAESLGASSSTIFCGSLDPNQVKREIDRARVFALVSSYEGMSFSLLEAMSRGKPVIVGRTAGNIEVVAHGRNGLVVDSEDTDEITQAVTSLLSNPDSTCALGRNARLTIEEKYSLDSTLRRTLSFIEHSRGESL